MHSGTIVHTPEIIVTLWVECETQSLSSFIASPKLLTEPHFTVED